MRKYHTHFLIMAMGLISSDFAHNETIKSGTAIDLTVPNKILEILNDYVKDTSTGQFSFNSCKLLNDVDESYQLSDIKTGIPVHICHVDFQKMMDKNGDLSISAAAKDVDSWRGPILANGKCLYILLIQRTKPYDEFQIIGLNPNGKNWDEKRVEWPENSDYTPVLIRCGSRSFFHFPQIDDYNLMNFYGGYKEVDPVARAFDEAPGEEKSVYISPEVKGKKFINEPLPPGAYLSDCRKIFKIIVDESKDVVGRLKDK